MTTPNRARILRKVAVDRLVTVISLSYVVLHIIQGHNVLIAVLNTPLSKCALLSPKVVAALTLLRHLEFYNKDHCSTLYSEKIGPALHHLKLESPLFH